MLLETTSEGERSALGEGAERGRRFALGEMGSVFAWLVVFVSVTVAICVFG